MEKLKYKYDITAEQSFKKVATFVGKPEGIIIFDSYNNEWFPLKMVQIDKVDFSLRNIKNEFHQTYGGSSNTEIFMPWHYSVELIGKNYFVLSTRPINYKSLIPGYENYISICISGDTNTDIYSPEAYRVIAHTIINPLHYLGNWRISPDDQITYHNIGSGFKEHQLKKNFR